MSITLRAVLFSFLLLIVGAGFSQSEKAGYFRDKSRAFLELKNFKDAELYADSILLIVSQSGNLDSIKAAYLWLYEVHTQQKDYEKAIHDFKMAEAYRDSAEQVTRNEMEAKLRSELVREQEAHRQSVASFENSVKDLQETAESNWRNTLMLLASMLVLAMVAIITLFRKRSQLQKTLDRSKSDLAQMQSFKEKLFTVLSYDLKNALSSFENLTQGLGTQLATLKKEETVQFLAQLYTTAGDLKSTLNNVVHWVGYQSNSKPFQPEIFDSKVLAEHVLEKFRVQMSGRNLTYNVFIPDRQYVFADKEMTGIILDNLVSNAVHFTRQGGVITCFSGRKDGLVTIGIKDSGVGISEGDIQKLFNMKEDFHSIGKSSHKGAGVGLGLCKELVERNGGRMYVESTVGQGSTFYFTLPEKKID